MLFQEFTFERFKQLVFACSLSFFVTFIVLLSVSTGGNVVAQVCYAIFLGLPFMILLALCYRLASNKAKELEQTYGQASVHRSSILK